MPIVTCNHCILDILEGTCNQELLMGRRGASIFYCSSFSKPGTLPLSDTMQT